MPAVLSSFQFDDEFINSPIEYNRIDFDAQAAWCLSDKGELQFNQDSEPCEPVSRYV